MAFEIKGENKCNLCGKVIKWSKTFVGPEDYRWRIEGTEADVVLTKKEDDVVSYEATVVCEKCMAKNKFYGTKKVKFTKW